MNKFKIAKTATEFAVKTAMHKVQVNRQAKALARKMDDSDIRIVLLQKMDHASMLTVYDMYRELERYDPEAASAFLETYHNKRFNLEHQAYMQ